MASFSCTYSDQDLRVLLQAVVDAKAADHALTQSEYDHARQAHGYGHTPRAKYIAKRLGASWQSLAAKALQGQERELTRRAYQEYAVEVEGIPSLNALQGLLKRERLLYKMKRLKLAAQC